MEMPLRLDMATMEALDTIGRNPLHRFVPSQRRTLYALLGPGEHPLGKSARGWLEIITAKRVLPIWQEAVADNDPENDPGAELVLSVQAPQHLLLLAEGILHGTIGYDVASKAAGDYWYVAGNLTDTAAQVVTHAYTQEQH